MAVKRTQKSAPVAKFDMAELEARMAAAMTPAAQMEAEVDSEGWKARRVEWASKVEFVLHLMASVETYAQGVVLRGRQDQSRLTTIRTVVETYLGHYLHQKERFNGVIADMRVITRREGLMVKDILEIDVHTPDKLGGGITTVTQEFDR